MGYMYDKNPDPVPQVQVSAPKNATKADGSTKTFGDAWNEAAAGFGDWVNTITGSKALNQFNASEAQKERDFNAEQAELQRKFEERLSNTTYQRTIADMKAAGVNPAMLSGLTGGNLVGTPSGSAASSSGASASSSSSGVSLLNTVLATVGLMLGRKLGASSKTVIINRR